MARKSISLDAESYELLRRQKRPGESFSDVVLRLVSPRVPISAFAGAWSNLRPGQRRKLDQVYAAIRAADSRHFRKTSRRWKGH